MAREEVQGGGRVHDNAAVGDLVAYHGELGTHLHVLEDALVVVDAGNHDASGVV